MKRFGHNLALKSLALTLLALTAGCSLFPDGLFPKFPPPYQAYPGEPRPTNEIAIVQTVGGTASRLAYPFFLSLDGERLQGLLDGTDEIHVLPGRHAFGLGFGPNGVVLGNRDQTPLLTLSFEAAAGRTYRIKGSAFISKGQSTPKRPSAHVIDKASGERVASEIVDPLESDGNAADAEETDSEETDSDETDAEETDSE